MELGVSDGMLLMLGTSLGETLGMERDPSKLLHDLPLPFIPFCSDLVLNSDLFHKCFIAPSCMPSGTPSVVPLLQPSCMPSSTP